MLVTFGDKTKQSATLKSYYFCKKKYCVIYSVNLRIQSEYRKIRTRRDSVFGLFSRSKAFGIIDFKPQTPPSDCIFKENSILKISDCVNYKHAAFVRKSLRRKNVVISNDIFTPTNSCCYKPSS